MLRLAEAADVPLLAQLYADTARTLGPGVYNAAQVAAWASFGADTPAFADYVLRARTWVLLDEAGAPGGFCGIGQDEEDDHGEVHSLYVRAALTRQGRGTRLLAHALADAGDAGARRFAAWVTPFSRPVFERAGFRLIETVSAPYQGVMFERYRVAMP